jgi:hypothetical protein
MIKLILTRKIKEQAFEIIMEMGKQEKREDIFAVLQLSKTDYITEGRVNTELLNRKSDSVHGRIILKNMEDLYGLIERINITNRYKLTQNGEYTLENEGSVFVPERGCYLIYTTDDPLSINTIIGFDLLSSADFFFNIRQSIYKEYDFKREIEQNKQNWQNGNKNNAKNQDITLPSWLLNIQKGTIIRLLAMGGENIQISSIEKQGRKSYKRLDVRAIIEFNEDEQPIVQIKRKNSNKMIMESKFEKPLEDVLRELLGKEGINLDRINGNLVLLVNFNNLSEKDISTFKTTRKFVNPSIKGYGKFENVDLKDIPIFPITKEDAISWGNWLLERKINEYMDEETYNKTKEMISEGFSPRFQVSDLLVNFKTMLQLFKNKKQIEGQFSKNYWYLQAPIDLTQEV